MDLFSQFPESYRQDEFLPRINDEKKDINDIDLDDLDQEDESKNLNKFENIKKVKSLRRRNILIMTIVIISIFIIMFLFENFLINLSLKLVENYSIKESITKTIILFINKINGYCFFPFFFILYLKYPLTHSFSFMITLITVKYIHAIIFLIYGVDRKKEIGFREFYESGSEKPNLQLQLILVEFFGFWRLIKSKNKEKNKKESNRHRKIANILISISAMVTIFTFLEEIFVGQCSIKSCLIGLIIGIIVYTIIYERICIQFMKGKFFIKSVSKNYFSFFFITFIELLVAILLYHNYNGIDDIFEPFEYNPWKDTIITQYNMNKIVLKKTIYIFFSFFIVLGIRNNYKFVISKKNKNYYNLDDIVQFNNEGKIFSIFKTNSLYTLPGIFVMCLMNYLQYKNYKIQLLYYLLTDIVIYGNFGYVWFGIGIKKSLKRHLDEGRELEEYQNLDYSDNKTPKGNNSNNKLKNII